MLGDWPLPTIRRTVRTNNVAVVRKEESVYSTGEARHDPGSAPVAAQGLLFTDDLPELREDTGYRGPTACRSAGITYRQLDYWARTVWVEPAVRSATGGFDQTGTGPVVEPSVRSATGSGTQRLY